MSPRSPNNLHGLSDISISPKLLSIINNMSKKSIKSALTSASRSMTKFTQLTSFLHSNSYSDVCASGRRGFIRKGKKIHITVSITDQGPGISEENQKLLFNNFVQVRASQLQQGQGSGLSNIL
jgi:signal transduction histidine kinase